MLRRTRLVRGTRLLRWRWRAQRRARRVSLRRAGRRRDNGPHRAAHRAASSAAIRQRWVDSVRYRGYWERRGHRGK